MAASSRHSSRWRAITFFLPRSRTTTQTLIVFLWRSTPTYFMGLLLLWKQIGEEHTNPFTTLSRSIPTRLDLRFHSFNWYMGQRAAPSGLRAGPAAVPCLLSPAFA